ncbi:hypothetical protein [Archangium sp.]|uniref:hypothetical protein n=1 Tax=Archangium sp. TaxID=1872627 RepID=UPI00389A8695
MRWIHGLSGVVLFTALQACTQAPEAPQAPATAQAPVASQQAPAAAAPRSFTATLVTRVDGKEDSSQLLVRGDVLRVGQPNAGDADLYDLGAGKKWILRPKQKLAVERNVQRSQVMLAMLLPDVSGNPCSQHPHILCTREGEETVDGRPLVKWRLDLASEKQAQKDNPALAWVDPSLGAMVRFAAEKQKLGFELRDLKAGPVDEALLQVPSDFTRVEGATAATTP